MDIRRLDTFAPAWGHSHGRSHKVGRHCGSDDAAAAGSATATATSGAQLAARLVTKEKGALDITTADGDKVSIRFKIREAVSLALSSTTDASGATSSSAEVSVLSRGRLKIEVEGELDDGELAAIDDLLGKVDELAQKFFGGNVEDAFAAAADLQFDGEELAGFNLQLTYSQKLAVNQRAFALAAAPTASTPPATLPDTPVTDAPVTDAPAADAPAAELPASDAPSAAPVSAQAVENAAVVEQLPAAIDAAAAATPDAPVTDPAPVDTPVAEAPATTPVTTPATTPAPTASPKQTIVAFLRDLLGSLGAVQGTASMQLTMRWKLDFVAQALPALAPTEQAAASPATKLLTDTLDKLASPAA